MDSTDLVKTSGKEFFYMVSGLMVPKYMVREGLMEEIEFFVVWVSKYSNNLEYLFECNMEKFVSRMEELYVMLYSIHAHWLEMEAARIMRLTDIGERSLCQNLIVSLVANMNTLALDIQMAQAQGFETGYRQRDEIERYRGIINSMKAVSTLIKSSEFEEALDMSISIDELRGSEYYVVLMADIASKNDERATNLIENIIKTYTQKIEDVMTAVTKTIELKKLMIVDDMPEVLTALRHMLKEHYQVFAFSDCEGALKFMDNKQQPDVFLLDVDMPEMDGFALAKKIRERPQYKNTPILFLTGNSTTETLMKSLLYGAKAFIVKPATKDIIISKISSCLD